MEVIRCLYSLAFLPGRSIRVRAPALRRRVPSALPLRRKNTSISTVSALWLPLAQQAVIPNIPVRLAGILIPGIVRRLWGIIIHPQRAERLARQAVPCVIPVTTSALGHDYESMLTAATCTEEGYIKYVCTRCGDSYTEDIPATGHSYQSKTVSPTCTSGGYTRHTCTRCGDSIRLDARKRSGIATRYRPNANRPVRAGR